MSEPRSVLFLDQFGTMGGGQRILCGMVRRAVESGWRVSVATPAGEVADTVTGLGARWHPLEVPVLSEGAKRAADVLRLASSAVGLRRQLRDALAAASPDVVHVNGARALLPVMASGSRLPLTYHAHTIQDDRSASLTRRMLATLRPVKVIAPSAVMARWASDRLQVPLRAVEVVGNWVDPEFRRTEAATARERPADGAEAVVGVVGRVTAIKGQLDALRAVLELRRRGVPTRLVLAGSVDGAYGEEIARVAAPDPGAVQALGPVDDVPRLLASFAAAAVPSLWDEPFGLAAVEAMACGVPVVAYDSGALGEIVGGAGVVVPAGDVDALTEALGRAVLDREFRDGLAAAGIERVAERFDYVRQTDKVLEILAAASAGDAV